MNSASASSGRLSPLVSVGLVVGTTAAAISWGISSMTWSWYHQKEIQKVQKERQAERTGRIRAEVKLRTITKNKTAAAAAAAAVTSNVSRGNGIERKNQSSSTNTEEGATGGTDSTINSTIHEEETMLLKLIGTVVSPYTKRMGTPRQGALVPSSRSFIDMKVPMETVDGLDGYSHAWIIFEFHANTDLSGTSKKTKIKPPRGGGIKVGQLATRSPHRPNALGLSLVKLDRIDAPKKRVYISALDLVNQTPVYDIKPCVPWDIPGYYHIQQQTTNDITNNINETQNHQKLVVPDWVSQEDALSEVRFTDSAREELEQLIGDRHRLCAPLYTSLNNGIEGAVSTLKEILAQDPRASRKRGSSTKTKESLYRIIFCRVQIEFRVLQGGNTVEVCRVSKADIEDATIVDGIPLIHSEIESKAE